MNDDLTTALDVKVPAEFKPISAEEFRKIDAYGTDSLAEFKAILRYRRDVAGRKLANQIVRNLLSWAEENDGKASGKDDSGED